MKFFAIRLFVGWTMLWAGVATLSAQSLATALDNTDLTWTTSVSNSASVWFGQTTTYYNGGSAAQSGNLYSSVNNASILQTTVTGPGTLTFWWKVTTTYLGLPGAGSRLTLKANGDTKTAISDNADWQQQTIYLGTGTQTVQWMFAYYTVPTGTGTGWVDNVTWTPGTTAPIITSQPFGQSEVAGLDATFRVSATGTPPLACQWRFNGTNIFAATNSACVISNVQIASLGNYCVVITNMAGSITSSVVPLVLGHVAAWGDYTCGETTIPDGNTNALAIGAGVESSLMLNPDRTVTAWGCYQTNMPDDLTNMIAVAGCYYHSLALKADGTVAGWGYDYNGDTDIPAGLSNVVAVSGGGYHSLALRNDGTVVAWGDNAFYQTNVPADLTNAVAISAGSLHNLALKADGTVLAWGYNLQGQCNVPELLTNVVAIAAGGYHSLALRANGTVTAWGSYGTNVPGNLSNVVAVAAGLRHGMALKADGTVILWGSYYAYTNAPAGLTNVTAIAAGWNHDLVLVGDGPPVQQVMATNAAVGTNGFSLTLPSQSGRVFRLEYKNNLADAGWTALPLVAGTGTNLTFTDSFPTNSTRFYRVCRW
jgi:hypothetical protein